MNFVPRRPLSGADESLNLLSIWVEGPHALNGAHLTPEPFRYRLSLGIDATGIAK